jgi:hypothetical protein
MPKKKPGAEEADIVASGDALRTVTAAAVCECCTLAYLAYSVSA